MVEGAKRPVELVAAYGAFMKEDELPAFIPPPAAKKLPPPLIIPCAKWPPPPPLFITLPPDMAPPPAEKPAPGAPTPWLWVLRRRLVNCSTVAVRSSMRFLNKSLCANEGNDKKKLKQIDFRITTYLIGKLSNSLGQCVDDRLFGLYNNSVGFLQLIVFRLQLLNTQVGQLQRSSHSHFPTKRFSPTVSKGKFNR